MKKRTVVLMSLGTALILGAVVASYFTIGGDGDGVVATNGELVITDGPSWEVLPQDDDPPDALFGYNPDPQATRQFLRELPAPTIREAGPGLFQARGPPEDVFLYRALYKAHQDRFQRDYVVGRQGIGDCFIGGTMVLMADGTEKPIEDVVVGDWVISHRGIPRVVTDKFTRKYTGDLVTVKAKWNASTVTATADHEFVAYPGIAYGKGSGNSKPDPSPQWVPVGELGDGDRVLLTRFPGGDTTQHIATRDGTNIPLTPEMGYLIGIYLAEGGLCKYENGKANRITFSLGSHEGDIVAKVAGLIMDCFGVEASIDNLPSKPSVTLVRCGNVTAAQAFQSIMPGNVYSKSVPSIVFQSPRDVRVAVIRGWMDGDGHVRHRKIGGGFSFQVQGTSASVPLLRSMRNLAMSCGMKPSHVKRKDREDRAESGDLYLYGDDALEVYTELRAEVESSMSSRGLRKSDRAVVDDGIASPIESIVREYVVDHEVHCITVDQDHSFVANGFGVHNCVGWGFASGCDVHLAVMWTLGDSAEWWPSSSESVYGGSRVQARGVSTGGWSDGSYGSAAAKFLRDWGIGFRKDYGDGIDLTVYSAKRAKDWGYYGAGGQGQPSFFIDDVKKHPVRSVALVTTFDEAAAAIQSGYPIPVCSMVGFTSTRDGQGFARASGTWAHAMCFIGARHGDRPGLLCLNSWGPTWINGPKWPDDQPDGSFWVDKATVNRMLAQRDSFVISGYDGFPFRKLDHAAWVEAKPKFWEEVLPSNEPFFALAP